ncbi:MAG TPA: hypothetical protein VF596_17975 [Pyrinomonadaceae bacterium]|jgi:RNA polymerase sigma factor (sigma-70 family)
MRREREIQPGDFETLLLWLDSDPARAEIKFRRIRARLVEIFSLRRCFDPEDLADETIDRVTLKINELLNEYNSGDPALYFYGVARNVYLESLRKNQRRETALETIPMISFEEKAPQPEIECLEKCLDRLPTEQRELVIEYFQDEKQAKIDHRKAIADALGITTAALRIRIFRLKNTLQACLEDCLEGTR